LKTILWIYDVKGWAYWNRAHKIAEKMPQYKHEYISTTASFGEVKTESDNANIVVCMFHGFVPMLSQWFDKTVVQCSGLRGM